MSWNKYKLMTRRQLLGGLIGSIAILFLPKPTFKITTYDCDIRETWLGLNCFDELIACLKDYKVDFKVKDINLVMKIVTIYQRI
jgi:hypothetical protein